MTAQPSPGLELDLIDTIRKMYDEGQTDYSFEPLVVIDRSGRSYRAGQARGCSNFLLPQRGTGNPTDRSFFRPGISTFPAA